MRETLAMSFARTAPVLLQNLILMNLKFPVMPAKDVALSQIICRTGLIAGAVTAVLRCNSGRATNLWHSAMAVTRSSTMTKNTAGTAGTHGGHPQQAADCLCPTSLVKPRRIPGLVPRVTPGEVETTTSGTAVGSVMLPPKLRRRLRRRRLRSGRRCRRRRRLTATPHQRKRGHSHRNQRGTGSPRLLGRARAVKASRLKLHRHLPYQQPSWRLFLKKPRLRLLLKKPRLPSQNRQPAVEASRLILLM